MHDEDDLPEPEHDHLLDHEFHDDDRYLESDAQGLEDDIEDEEPLDDWDDDGHPAWHDDVDDD